MSKKIIELRPKEDFEGVLLIKHIVLNSGRDGRSYLNLIFADNSADLEGRLWNNSEGLAETLKKGDFAWVSGKVNFYQGRMQLVVKDMRPAEEGSYIAEDFVPTSSFNPDKMLEQLKDIVSELGDVYIKELLTKVLEDPEIQRRLKFWQAGKSIHHAYQSGLLEHILSCAELSMQLSKRYEVNESYVVAGAILHDLCKIYELTSGLLVDYTEEGKLVGHLSKGVEIIDRYSSKIKGFPYSMKLHLKHIILSHHGQYEYGSPKLPQTREAMLVHLIDFMDSKMHSFKTVIDTDKTPGHWSGYVKHLDRVVFKDELPTFSEFLPVQSDDNRPSDSRPRGKKNFQSKEPKNNLGKLLKDFKVEE